MSARKIVVFATSAQLQPAFDEHGREVLHHLLGLRGDVAIDDLHGLRVEGDLSGREEKAADDGGLRIGADGLGRVGGLR